MAYPLLRPLPLNPLSQHWRQGNYSCATPLVYLGGMACYLISIPRRIGGIVKEFLFFIGRFFYSLRTLDGTHIWRETKVGFLVFAGSIGEFFIGIIGIICPPLAYSLDEKLYNHRIIFENSLNGSIAQWLNHQGGRRYPPDFGEVDPVLAAALFESRQDAAFFDEPNADFGGPLGDPLLPPEESKRRADAEEQDIADQLARAGAADAFFGKPPVNFDDLEAALYGPDEVREFNHRAGDDWLLTYFREAKRLLGDSVDMQMPFDLQRVTLMAFALILSENNKRSQLEIAYPDPMKGLSGRDKLLREKGDYEGNLHQARLAWNALGGNAKQNLLEFRDFLSKLEDSEKQVIDEKFGVFFNLIREVANSFSNCDVLPIAKGAKRPRERIATLQQGAYR